MDEGNESDEHIPSVEGEISLTPGEDLDGLTPAQARYAELVDAVDKHLVSARQQADVLVSRAQTLVRNGVDLRAPERAFDFVTDQVMDAVRAATVHDCQCSGAQGAAAAALLAEVTRRLAVELEGRDR